MLLITSVIYFMNIYVYIIKYVIIDLRNVQKAQDITFRIIAKLRSIIANVIFKVHNIICH